MRLPIKLSLRKYLSEQKGSALVMVLMATVGVTALTLVVIQARKNGASIATRSKADRDVERAVSLITTLLITPDSCSANFKVVSKLPLNGPLLNTIKKCNGGTPACDAINIYDPTNPSWVMFSGETPSKARLAAIYYRATPTLANTLITAQTTGLNHAPANVEISLVFQKNLGMNNGTITISTLKAITFYIPLVTDLTFATARKILGCPRSASSTIPY